MRRSRRAMLILRYNLWEFYFSRLTVLRIHGHCSENLTSLLRVAIEEMIIVMKTTLWGKLNSFRCRNVARQMPRRQKAYVYF